MSALRINRSLEIPESELKFTFSPSGGPGGQHANKTSTRAELTWDVAESPSLGPRQRAKIRSVLKHRIDSSGVLRLTSDRYRSQTRNREDAIARLVQLLREALVPRVKRVPTKPHKGATERRIAEKKRRGDLKRQRRGSADDY
ncbi:MAG: ribosome-associated protein [Actinomycetota bacterium]|jgi:ribosome-associated protein|nr:ribosome-associated protein [Actinomycetota bacterium]